MFNPQAHKTPMLSTKEISRKKGLNLIIFGMKFTPKIHQLDQQNR